MCVVTFRIDSEAEYPFVFIGNRDEHYSRPSVAAHFWLDYPNILAGRDIVGRGTWLGITREGRFATILNHPFREWTTQGPKVSRGQLANDFLMSEMSVEDFTSQLQASRRSYDGYQMVFGDIQGLRYYSNIQDRVFDFNSNQTYSLSNTEDDLSSFRVSHSIDLLDRALIEPINLDKLIRILQNPDKNQNFSHFPQELDYQEAHNASSVFIQSDHFGTVSSTAVLIDREGKLSHKEVRYSPEAIIEVSEKEFKLNLN